MVQKLDRETIVRHAIVHAAPPAQAKQPLETDRSFELPAGLYGVTVGCYLAFLVVTGLSFSTPGLILPMVIFAFVIIAGFSLPTIWARLAPDSPVKSKSWARFQRDGIQTHTGHNTAGQATVQVLILPVLILVWGLAVVTIAATVG